MMLSLILTLGAVDSMAQTKKTTTRKKPVIKKAPARTTPAAPPAVKLYTVEQGQAIRVRMNGNDHFENSQGGRHVQYDSYRTGLFIRGVIVVPVGSTVIGQITAVTPAAKGGKPGTIDVDFTTIKTPNGSKYVITGDLTELDSKSAKSDNEGTASGDKMKHRKIIFIGGGGAGGGFGRSDRRRSWCCNWCRCGCYYGFDSGKPTKGEEATVKANTEFGVLLNKSVSMPKFIEPIE